MEALPPEMLSDPTLRSTAREPIANKCTRVPFNFSAPGKPVQNAHIESFHGRFRDECLNDSWFVTLADARRIIEAWRVDGLQHRVAPECPGVPDARGVRAAHPDRG